MGIGTLLIGLALFIIVVVYVASPLFEMRRPAVVPPSRQQTLELERAAIVRTIRELDLDYRTGKLNEADYKGLREIQVQNGATALRELDEVSRQAEDAADAEARIETQEDAQIAAQIEEQIEARVAALRNAPATCKSCGTLLQPGARFCANCGSQTAQTAKTKKTTGSKR